MVRVSFGVSGMWYRSYEHLRGMEYMTLRMKSCGEKNGVCGLM